MMTSVRKDPPWAESSPEDEAVVIEAFPDEEETDEAPAPRRPLPRAARRPPWAAVLPAPLPVREAEPRGEADAVVLEVPLQQLTRAAAKVLSFAPERRAGMVVVPPREVKLGDRRFVVESFLLDQDVVTRAQWAEWLAARGDRRPRPGEREARLPVTDVSYAEARAYAAWRGLRLPTVAEWLAAAAGLSWFPHGQEVCPVGLCQCPRAGMPREVSAVGAHPASHSDDGVHDLLGNVWEWCDPDPRLSGPDPDHAWALGGSYRHVCPGADPAARRVPQTMIHVAKTWPYLGFRCARSAA